MGKNRHPGSVEDSLKHFGPVPFLRLDFGTMNKLRAFWSNFGEEVLLVFISTIPFLELFLNHCSNHGALAASPLTRC